MRQWGALRPGGAGCWELSPEAKSSVPMSQTLVPAACASLISSGGHRDEEEEEASAITLLAPKQGILLALLWHPRHSN